jgi:hypothetical protein
VEITRQHSKADIVAVIDNRLVLLIEDKIHALPHGNQLGEYLARLTEEFPSCKVLPTFVKTGDQSGYAEIEADGYRLFLREDLLHVLRNERLLACLTMRNPYRAIYDHFRLQRSMEWLTAEALCECYGGRLDYVRKVADHCAAKKLTAVTRRGTHGREYKPSLIVAINDRLVDRSELKV